MFEFNNAILFGLLIIFLFKRFRLIICPEFNSISNLLLILESILLLLLLFSLFVLFSLFILLLFN